MSVICFASLKGGVGKTSLSLNVAHAFAQRGCRTLLIDFDPSAHTSRFFTKSSIEPFPENGSLAKLFLRDINASSTAVEVSAFSLIISVRQDLSVLPGGPELRHLLWGKGSQVFARRFPLLLKEFMMHFDHIVIDTAPDYNVLTRNALAAADLAVVPVDGSEMSIHSLEELISCAQHLRKPAWAIIRTMVSKAAAKTRALSNSRLGATLDLQPVKQSAREDGESFDIENAQDFMRMLQQWGEKSSQQKAPTPVNPIFLLRSLIYRTEQQNQLSFIGKTSFDSRATIALSENYLQVARELESILSAEGIEDGDFFSAPEASPDLPKAELSRQALESWG